MKQLLIQIQHPPDDVERDRAVRQVSQAIADGNAEIELLPDIKNGPDYTNFLAQAGIWSGIGPKLESLRLKMIVTCQGEDGWNDYKLLYHFDSKIKLDQLND